MSEIESPRKEQTREELFGLLVESVRDYAIFLLDPTGHIMSWNEGARRIKGYSSDEIIGKHFSIFYPAPDIRHGKPDYGLRVAADEGRWEEEGWRIRKDGSRFWASVVVTALFGQDGNLVGFAKVTRDLSERKRSEEERAQLLELEHASRTRAETMLERLEVIQRVTEAALAHLNLDDLLKELLDRITEILEVDTVAVLLLDEVDTDVLVARAAKGIEEEVEQGVRVPVGTGFAGRIAAERRAVVLDDVEHADVMNPLLLQKGVRSLMGVPLLIEGRVLGVLHVGSLYRRQFRESDVQLLQIVADRVSLAVENARLFESAKTARYEADLAEATVKARDEFLSIAAHELKTPLTSLRIASQSAMRRLHHGDETDMAALERSLRIVDRQVDRLSRLISQLLETVRVQAGRAQLDLHYTNLLDVVEDVLDHMQGQTDRHEVAFHAGDPIWTMVDPLRLDQVIVNLLDNAVKFSPPGERIDVSLERPSREWARIAVRDRGVGVAPEHRAHLFERFYQAHGSEYRSGMGLGLYISRQIVEMHGGRIAVEFPADGGTQFIVDLPVQTDDSHRTDSL